MEELLFKHITNMFKLPKKFISIQKKFMIKIMIMIISVH